MALVSLDANAQQFWDGADTTSGNGAPTGGTGTWDASTTNWTDGAAGTNNQAWASGNAVFGGPAGTVTVSGTQTTTGITVDTDGYIITGGTLNSAGATIDVTTGTTTIATTLIGSGLTKTGSGILTLSGNNTALGATTVRDGQLVAGSATALSSGILDAQTPFSGPLTVDLGGFTHSIHQVAFTAANNTSELRNGTINIGLQALFSGNGTVSAVIAGGGVVRKTLNSGTLVTFSGVNTYTGETSLDAGGIAISSTGSILATSDITINVTGLLDVDGAGGNALGDTVAISNAGEFILTGSDETIGSISGAGSINLNANSLTTGGDNTSTAVSGIISGVGGGLSKEGTGTLTLSGNNTQSGITAINNGTVAVSGGTLSGASSVAINNNATLQINGGAMGAGSVLQINGTSTFDVDTSTSATIVVGAAGSFIDVAAGQTLTMNQLAAGNVASTISGGGDLTKTGGSTLTLSGNNTFTGDVRVSDGTLTLGHANALGNGSTVRVGGTLDLGGFTVAKNNFIVQNGTVQNGTMDLIFASAAASQIQNATINANLAGIGGITSAGSGTSILSAANTFAGDLVAARGTINVTGSTTTAVVNITDVDNNGAGIQVNGNSIADNADVTIANSGILTLNADETIGSLASSSTNASVVLGTNTLTTGSAGNTTYAGSISGAGGLTKQGAGTFTLSGANSYTGTTTVSSGTLVASTAGSLGSTTLANANVNGGTLDLGGATHTLQTALVQSGGTLQNGTLNVTGFFGSSGTVTSTVNATGYSLLTPGGTITTLGATGVDAENTTAAGISLVGTATSPAINNATGHGVQLDNSNGGDVLVTVGSGVGSNITGLGGDGINIVSTGGGIVTVDGGNAAITIQGGNGAGNDGIDITADGNTLVSVNGAIVGDPGVVFNSAAGANFTLNGTGDVTGVGDEGVLVNTTGGNGDVIINRNGAILGTTNGVDARTTNGGAGTGTVTVTSFAGQSITGTNNAGVVTRTDAGLLTVNGAGPISGFTFGVDAQTLGGGNVSVAGSGTTSSSGAGSTTINAASTAGNGAVTVNRTGAINNTGTGATAGINARTVGAGDVIVTNSGGVTIAGTGSTAINAVHTGAASASVVVNGAGAVTSTGTGASNGINATNDSNGIVDVDTGVVTLATASTGTGINAVSIGAGNVNVDNAGAVNGGLVGINAQTNGAGTATVTLGADIGDVTAPTSGGIRTAAATGATNITGAFNVTGGDDGILASSAGGAINVTGLGNITTATTNTFTDVAVEANSGGGNVVISNNGNISGGQGIAGISSGGSLEIQGNGTISGLAGVFGHGITYNSAGGNINIGTTTANGNITGSGTNGDGIELASTAGNIAIGRAGTASIITGAQDGIDADTTTGNITILRTGTITGTAGDGVNAASSGAGTINVAVGAVTGGDDGIFAQSAGGSITVTTGGDVTGTADAGIEVGTSTTANVNVGAGHTVSGGVAAIRSAAAIANVSNLGTLNSAGATNLIFDVTAGIFSMTNGATVNGSLQSSAGATTSFTNAVGGQWNLNSSTFTMAGMDTINNNGIMSVNGTTTLNGVEVFNNAATGVANITGVFNLGAAAFDNSGAVSMQNGATGDQLVIDGNYSATNGLLNIDTVLDGDGSATDLLVVNNNTSGSTTVSVNNIGGTGAATVNGIQVVQVNGTANGTFTLNGDYTLGSGEQAISGGVFSYTLQQQTGGWFLSSTSASGAMLFLPSAPVYEAYPQILSQFNSIQSFYERIGGRLRQALNEPQERENEGSLSATSSYGGVQEGSQHTSGIWARVEGSHSELSASSSTTASSITTDIGKAQFGVDAQLRESENGRLFVGVNGWTGKANAKIKSVSGDGSINSKGYGVGLSGTWLADNGFYADAQANFSWFDSDLTSASLGSLVTGNNGFGQSWSVEMGIETRTASGLIITPQAQLEYSSIEFDAISPTVSLQNGDRLKGRFGLSVAKNATWESSNGVVKHGHFYGIANLHHDFSDGTAMNFSGVTLNNDSRGGNVGEIGLGFNVNWDDNKYAIFGQAKAGTDLGDFGNTYNYSGSVGFKLNF